MHIGKQVKNNLIVFFLLNDIFSFINSFLKGIFNIINKNIVNTVNKEQLIITFLVINNIIIKNIIEHIYLTD